MSGTDELTDQQGKKLESSPGEMPSKQSKKEQILPAPTLEAYFGADPIPAGAFVKAVRLAEKKTRRFADDDVERAERLQDANDPDGSRLLALAATRHLPDAIERWIWSAVQRRLKSLASEDFDPTKSNPTAILKCLRPRISRGLRSKERTERASAETALRLALSWLISQRALDPEEAFEVVGQLYFADTNAAKIAVRSLLLGGKMAQLRDAAAVVVALGAAARSALLQSAEDRDRIRLLEVELKESRNQLALERRRVEELANSNAVLTSELLDERQKLADRQRHWGMDAAELKATHRTFLTNRLLPLITDAIDAIEIEPPAPEIALRRLRSAVDAMERGET